MQNRTRAFSLAIIILSIFIFGLVSLRNSQQESEFSPGSEDQKVDEQPISPTDTEEEGVLGAETTVAERKVQVFIDKDKDSARSNSESSCDVCIGKALVATSQSGSAEPGVAELNLVNISGSGTVNEADLLHYNRVWGFFDDRKILIPQQNLLLGDAVSDINIYAVQVNLIISGVNANLRDISVTDANTVVYEFDSLISSLRTTQTNGTDVWLQFIPDIQNPGIYYLAKGKVLTDVSGQVTGVPNNHYMSIKWGFDNEYSTLTKAENMSFILL